MVDCPDICTAAKCEELEARISRLEQALELIEAAFEAHTLQEIPEAHNYDPLPNQLDLNLSLDEENNLELALQLGNDFASSSIKLPTANLDNVDLIIRDLGQNLFQFELFINEYVVTPTLQVVEPQVDLAVFELDTNRFGISLQLGEQHTQAEFEIQQTEEEQEFGSLEVSADYVLDTLTIVVRHGDDFGIAQVTIDAETIINNSGGGSTVTCEQKIDECCQLILAAINDVYQEITIDISGTAYSEYQCLTPEPENPEDPPPPPEFTPVLTPYGGSGLRGIHENLKLINANLDSIFEATCAEIEPGDVVSIVASDKVLGRHQGKTLILHLVTTDNYPFRSRNSTYYPVHIPEARETYTWQTDFESLSWSRGNLYCELFFEGIRDPVSGWFADKDAANVWFDAVAGLTTATEKNRKYHEQLNPARTITQRVTRPYRAFITSINAEGEAVCEVKYTPVVPNE